ncbi:MAG: aspartate--tRNA(Asp/Asn) ligase [Actinobacteria bacterium BACL2 MAG-121001-bin67]|uniref:Aspartate--tRNA(Asp/Asn) ligase n=5 Tax=ac1 cluster TaxID=1655545 RepID=A0A0R2P614_9ACTN|nr:MAG: aspartate--tRNA(Asp/Asn) ligase [Actinobacteria bacterium BACL2 MAG-120802-bin41]KRO32450.1 MAG: aspartate--tRNA(Asp/Asn) ligase [Actinobacteria bacterium BACL2 MAG-121001-bin67]KRO32471.1 MAG: aspartate--tRNA(Asp/Asn) ligase [Actinobacteria bacterium BACL2 MAG-121220-bin52]KRO59930.1 MAG: aspartate--tRNA(Asp/Asn) ligase [Pelagibacteraceae bacterium BACL5 MAG-120705-bin12]KRP31120.1 MAG: aspartate--tRNA(Asp/Asn) ligase [Actinobacteria bacterium BACL2 MAG-120507-bin38]MDP4615685.1 aspar
MLRSHSAGTLRSSDIGGRVKLAGWVARRRDHGGVAFIDLRDYSGSIQVVISDEKVAAALRAEWCVLIEGVVTKRPSGNENTALPTGEIEINCESLEVLSEAAALPFPVDSGEVVNVGEEVRLKYRYLDLRREGPSSALRLRSKVTSIIRSVMDSEGFLDIETPYLTRSTPEGARDFLVPVRLQPGSWYALPQSPQLFKQLLMVAGMERYYQIARCFRDEDFRADRQPEFTQLDIEMSFIDQSDVLAVAEKILKEVFKRTLDIDIALPISHMTYHEALRRFGSDKPDLRFGNELVDVTDFFKETSFRVFQAEFVGAVVMPNGAASPRRELDAWQDWAKARGAKGLAYILVGEDGSLGGPVAKNLSERESKEIASFVGAKNGDAIFFAAGDQSSSLQLLGAVRLEIGERCHLIAKDQWKFLWVVDAPMFEATESGGWTAVHHPFTGPKPEYEKSFKDDPKSALAYAYDIVLNGNEIGGGSIRIHKREIQQAVFDVIGLTKQEAESKFGFLLEAFNYGPPPHGGIALGLDRLCALLAGAESIREVIAFPKTASGADPLTGAPTPITTAQRRESGVDFKPE